MREFAVVLDLGGTNLRAAGCWLGEDDGFFSRITTRSISHLPREEGMRFLKEEVIGKILERGRGEGGRAKGAVLGVPGWITPEGELAFSPHLPQLKGVNLIGEMDFDGLPVMIENDANLYALGEGRRGAAQGAKTYCALTLGTGLGGGIVMEGRLLKGAFGSANEVGHMVVEAEGVPCWCGSRGCLEAYASGSAIKRMAEERGLKVHSSEEVFRAAQNGDQGAREVFAEMGKYLGVGMANLVNLFSPEVIVIGGKVAGAWDFFIPHALEEMRKRAFHYPAGRVKVKRASLGDDAALWGGVSLLEG